MEIVTRDDPDISKAVEGKVIEAGGPEGTGSFLSLAWFSRRNLHPLSVITYRQVMELVLRYGNRTRPIISLPWTVGTLQGALLEQLPPNLFTITRDQVSAHRRSNEFWNVSQPLTHFLLGRTIEER